MIGKLLCRLFGHKRGKRVTRGGTQPGEKATYECPRCKATWTRKVQKKGAE